MKKKRTFIGAALIAGVLCLGVGYAALSSTSVSVTGTATATANDENFKVTFDTETDITLSDASLISASYTDETVASITVTGLSAEGDSAYAIYTIKNYSDGLNATLAEGSITNEQSDYFDVAVEITSASLAPGDSTTVKITVTLKKTVSAEVSGNISVPIVATPVESD